jgi:hypothetical protein
MNSKDTVLAVMKDVKGLRMHDHKTGQDARWQGLDKVPDAALHSMKMHGGRLTHEVLFSSFSNSTNYRGVKIDIGAVSVRFNIFGSDMGEPVTGEASGLDTSKGANASAKVYKRALRTFLVNLLQLPGDRAEPGSPFLQFNYLDEPNRRKSKPKDSSAIEDIPWSPRTEALGAQIAFLTTDEYAAEWARYFIDSSGLYEDMKVRPRLITAWRKWLPEALQEVGFSKAQAEYGASQQSF